MFSDIKLEFYYGLTYHYLRSNSWSLGLSLNYDKPESYLCINLFKLEIFVGKLIK